ncbi:hypothetical protein WISP_30289 [Willisornis vidua]|uniref:DUF4637 domain-containing protein n=1 Tax=Willisornis vidua TaxID=1566151 RepID=A0ABQ9DKB3_9PASS|nr:hypothetical protein WISP_30289 [Willisornis vidua]
MNSRSHHPEATFPAKQWSQLQRTDCHCKGNEHADGKVFALTLLLKPYISYEDEIPRKKFWKLNGDLFAYLDSSIRTPPDEAGHITATGVSCHPAILSPATCKGWFNSAWCSQKNLYFLEDFSFDPVILSPGGGTKPKIRHLNSERHFVLIFFIALHISSTYIHVLFLIPETIFPAALASAQGRSQLSEDKRRCLHKKGSKKLKPAREEICSLRQPHSGKMCPKCEILTCRKCETLHSESSFIAHSLLDHYDRGGATARL